MFKNLLWSSDGTLCVSEEDSKTVLQHFGFGPNFGNNSPNNTNNANNVNFHPLPTLSNAQRLLILDQEIQSCEKNDQNCSKEEHDVTESGDEFKKRQTELFSFGSEENNGGIQQNNNEFNSSLHVIVDNDHNPDQLFAHNFVLDNEKKQQNEERLSIMKENELNTLPYFDTMTTISSIHSISEMGLTAAETYCRNALSMDTFEASEKFFAELINNDKSMID
jgi:hypothetical protein